MEISSDAFVRCVRTAQQLLASCTANTAALPIDIEAIAERLGFTVVRLYDAPVECAGIVSPRHRLIGINGTHHHYRQRFSLAHEIGHLVLHHPAERKCSRGQIARLNREADTFASELLIPTPMLRSLLGSLRCTPALARLFDVSEEAMERKLCSLDRYVAALEGEGLPEES